MQNRTIDFYMTSLNSITFKNHISDLAAFFKRSFDCEISTNSLEWRYMDLQSPFKYFCILPLQRGLVLQERCQSFLNGYMQMGDFDV